MQKRTREILALVLLGVLAVVGVSAMAWYILVGHSWNVTASNIDDTIGQMDGYSVVLYEGARLPAAQGDAVEMDSAAQIYRDKGAAVFSVDDTDLARYSEPFIVSKKGVRIGFLAAGKGDLRSAIRAEARLLADQGAHYIVAVTDDPRLPDVAGEGLVGGISVVICADPKGNAPDGEYRGSTYCVSAPAAGEVGALVISPSGVFTSKTVEPVEAESHDALGEAAPREGAKPGKARVESSEGPTKA